MAGACARLYHLGYNNFWYDESFTAWLAGLPLERLFAATVGDVHPPLWYVVEWVITTLAGGYQSEALLRLPAAVLGVVNIWLFWRVCQGLSLPTKVSSLALLAFTFAPFQLYYSQEARMYQMMQAGVLLATVGLLEDRRWWFAVGSLLALWSQNLALFPVAMLSLWAWWRWRKGVVLPGVVVCLGWAPWLVFLFYQVGNMNGGGFWIQDPGVGTLFYSLKMLALFIALPTWADVHGAVVVLALALFGAAFLWEERRRPWALFILTMAFGPLLMEFAVSKLWRPIILFRSLIPSSGFLYIVMAWAVHRIADRRKLAIVAAMVITVWALALGNYYWNAESTRRNVSAYCGSILENWQPGDIIFSANVSSYILFDYYLRPRPHAIHRQSNDLSQNLSDQTKAAMGFWQVDDPTTLAGQYKRMWLVYVEGPTTAMIERENRDRLLERYPVLLEDHFIEEDMLDGVIYLLDLRGG